MAWTEVTRVVLATTSEGPWYPDKWLFFINTDGEELPIPLEAKGLRRLFPFLETKLPGFDFAPFLLAATDDNLYECWRRSVA